MPIAGKTNNLKMGDFMKFARTLKLDEQRATEIVNEVVDAVVSGAAEIAANPPEPIRRNESVAFALKHIATEIIDQAAEFGAAVPEWEPVRTTKSQRRAMKMYARKNGFLGMQND